MDIKCGQFVTRMRRFIKSNKVTVDDFGLITQKVGRRNPALAKRLFKKQLKVDAVLIK